MQFSIFTTEYIENNFLAITFCGHFIVVIILKTIMEESMKKLNLTGITETPSLEKMAKPLQFWFNLCKKEKRYSKFGFILYKAE